MDAEEQLTRALEPGEKIVWSDRPHGLLSAIRRTAREEPWTFVLAACALGFDAWVAGSIAGRLEIGAAWKRPTPLFYLVLAALFAFVLIVAFALTRRVVARLRDVYAATDRGRLIVVTRGRVRNVSLPPPADITTSSRARHETGRIEVRITLLDGSLETVRLHDVSYPLIAVETLRSVARSARNC